MSTDPFPPLNKEETKRFLEIDAKPITPEEIEEAKRNVELFLRAIKRK